MSSRPRVLDVPSSRRGAREKREGGITSRSHALDVQPPQRGARKRGGGIYLRAGPVGVNPERVNPSGTLLMRYNPEWEEP